MLTSSCDGPANHGPAAAAPEPPASLSAGLFGRATVPIPATMVLSHTQFWLLAAEKQLAFISQDRVTNDELKHYLLGLWLFVDKPPDESMDDFEALQGCHGF